MISKDKILFVHARDQFEDIEVGFVGNRVRFVLTKKEHPVIEGYRSQTQNQLVVTHEVPRGYRVVKVFDDLVSPVKGVELKIEEMKVDNSDGFVFS
jgi:hypothetical protein